MTTEQVIERTSDAMAVRRVFGEPIERDGIVVIPAAFVMGGGGVGETPSEQKGEGAGFGLSARPVGVFAIERGRVRWRPAVNVNRIIAGAQIVAAFALLTIRAYLGYRAAMGPRRFGLLRAR